MPTVTKFPTSNQSAGSPFNGAWTSPNNAHADDGVYATAAPGKNQEFASVWSVPFGTSDIPNGAGVTSVTVEVQWKCSTNASVATLRSSAFADSAQTIAVSASPGVNDTAEPTTDTIRTYSATPTLAELRDLWVRVQAMRGNTNTAFTASLDYLKVTVVYTDPPAAISGSGGVSFGLATSGSGTAALPSVTGSGGVTFGFLTGGSGTVELPGIVGSGGVAFGFATTGSGTVVSPGVSGSGGVAFGFASSGAGTSEVPVFTGSGGVGFGITLNGEGTTATPTFTGSGGVAFGFSVAAEGTSQAPAGTIAGSGGVSFGFSTGGAGSFTSTEPGPTMPPIDPDGPWISHGTIHLGHEPHH